MGRVFKYAEIKAGLVPSTDDFMVAAEMLVGEAERAVSNGRLDGGFVFGSSIGLLNGNPRAVPNNRSDLDCLLVLPEYTPENLLAIRSLSSRVSAAVGNRITTQPIVYTRDQLEHGDTPGMHEIDRIFGTDLVGSARHVIGNDPAEYMRFPDDSALSIFSSFISQKRRKLHDGITQPPHSDIGIRTTQRFLELPISTSRKAIQALVLGGVYANEDFWAADKRQVFEAVPGVLFDHNPEPVKTLDYIRGKDADYSALLAETLQDKVSETDYSLRLNEIADYISGIELLDWIHQSVTNKLCPTTSLQSA